MDKRDLQRIILNYSLRGRVFSYPELYVLTGQRPSYFDSKKILDYLIDPNLSLIDNYKNFAHGDTILQNYNDPNRFQIQKSRHGFQTRYNNSTGFNFFAKQLEISNNWYWRQLKLQKYGFWFYCIPGLDKLFICSSTVNKTASDHSDVDLLVLTQNNSVWFTKVYFAIVAKILKYYNFNFAVGLWNYIFDKKALALQKEKCLEGKLKIDFGLVTSDLSLVDYYYGPIWYRSLFVYELLEINRTATGYSRYNNWWKAALITRNILKFLLFLFYPLAIIFGLLNHTHNLKTQKTPSSKIVQWDIYSQYNLMSYY
jgi:hypothetical protein